MSVGGNRDLPFGREYVVRLPFTFELSESMRLFSPDLLGVKLASAGTFGRSFDLLAA